MWFILALACVFCWGFADLFYKKGTDENDRYSHLRIAVWVGLVMGVSSAVLLFFCESGASVLSPANLLKYAPASLSYIVSMVIGYAGLRYLEISIISPVQNSSGALSALLMVVFFSVRGGSFREAVSEATGFVFSPEDASGVVTDVFLVAGILLIVGGVLALAVVEKRLAGQEREVPKEQRKYKLGALALIFPILYCLFDTVGTAADGIILDPETGLDLGEMDVLVLYGFTFFLMGLAAWIFLLIREKKPYLPHREWNTKGIAALFEQGGQIFYVFAMGARPVLAAPLVASYCIVSVIASRIFLKEKLKRPQLVCVILVIVGIVLLGVVDGLAEA
ncbi:MAG: DMT family transporter [Clostridia bacterium]|nr:DMT family transporter [Clostridia bacterium]